MTFFSIFAFGKEYILFNDSLVIMSVMGLLLALLIKNLGPVLTELFNTSRITTQNDLTVIVKDILKFSVAYRGKLEDLILLNSSRYLLIPNIVNVAEDISPEFRIKEVSFDLADK